MKYTIKTILILSLSSIITLIVKAFIFLPIPQRGMEGHGLYRFVNGLQFCETAVFTFLVVFIMSYWIFKLYAHWSGLLGLAYSSINFGIMIFDARIHQYTPWVEKIITSMFGPELMILLFALVPIIFGVALIYNTLKRDGLITRQCIG